MDWDGLDWIGSLQPQGMIMLKITIKSWGGKLVHETGGLVELN